MWTPVALALPLALAAVALPARNSSANYTLPSGFLFGLSSSAYQSEGAWNISGKGVSVLDYGYHLSGAVNGDIAGDGYHHVAEDVAILKHLKVNAYRFSLSWTRLLPNGKTDNINPDGVRFYNELLDALAAANIEPIVTLHHFDLPQVIQEKYNGWIGRETIDLFAEFAAFAFKTFGSKVRYWTTFNEPNLYCDLIYSIKLMPPGTYITSDPEGSYYRCLHYQLLAHGKAYRLYRENYYNATQGGMVGLTIDAVMARPYNTSSESDVAAAERYNLFEVGMTAHPLVFGHYPELVRVYVDQKSYEGGLNESRLPSFTEAEMDMMRDSVDFIALNIYFGVYVIDSNDTVPDGAVKAECMSLADADATRVATKGSNTSFTASFNAYTPWVMRDALLYIRDNYNNTPTFVTENGIGDNTMGSNDTNREGYLSGYLQQLVTAAHVDNASVIGMTAWGFQDDFEFSSGYNHRMGIVHVNFTSPNKTRTLKKSASFVIQMMTDWEVPVVQYYADTTSTSGSGAMGNALTIYILFMSVLFETFKVILR